MALFVLGDTHLSFGVPEKPMDIFQGWENYQVLLEYFYLLLNCVEVLVYFQFLGQLLLYLHLHDIYPSLVYQLH